MLPNMGGGLIRLDKRSSVPSISARMIRFFSTTRARPPMMAGWSSRPRKRKSTLTPSFFDLYGSVLSLDNNYRMKLEKDKPDVKENRHQRFQLFYKNILVLGADYALHFRPDDLRPARPDFDPGRLPRSRSRRCPKRPESILNQLK